MRTSDYLLAIFCGIVISSPIAFYSLKASDKKEFGELLGTIGHDKIYRFETPSAVCFVREASISCVANK